MSLDGYIADRAGKFDWSVPDAEVHAVINDLTRSVGTLLLGRRLYEVLVAWESLDVADQPPAIKDLPRSGGQPTRSCTPRRSRPRPAPGPGSKPSSTPMLSDG
jgi:hypothetical protein